MRGLVWYALGAGTAAVAFLTSGPVGRALRPAAKQVIKGSLAAGRDVQRRAEETRSTFDDLVAEANAELDTEGGRTGEAGQP